MLGDRSDRKNPWTPGILFLNHEALISPDGLEQLLRGEDAIGVECQLGVKVGDGPSVADTSQV